MPPRRPHLKSRHGCTTCKQRHVKCDEKGPPCGACQGRGTHCEYLGPQYKALPSTKGLTVEGDVVEELIRPDNRRLLELQLMNRWSTTTYKSLITKIAEDDYVWHTKIPTLSLQSDFLLNGIFALSAFEIASTGPDQSTYIDIGMECQALALNSFRRQLPSHDTNFEAVLCFSMMLMVLALGSAQFMGDSMISNTITHFELLRGCGTLLEGHEDYLAENPYVQKLKQFEDLPKQKLDSSIEIAMSKLNELNEKRAFSEIQETEEQNLLALKQSEACKTAIVMLQECFSKCANADYDGYALGWLNMAGNEYMKAIRDNDLPALLILMFWGVLIDRLGRQIWWAKYFGRLLVEEISLKIDHGHMMAQELTNLAHLLMN